MSAHSGKSVLCDVNVFKEALARKHLSHTELARRVNFAKTQGSIDDVEGTERERRTILRLLKPRRISRKTAIQIAKALGIPFRRLVIPDLKSGDSISDAMKQIEAHDRHGEFDRAIQIGEQWCEHLGCVANADPDSHSPAPDTGINDPRYGELCVLLATVYDHVQQWDRAIERLNECLDLNKSILPVGTQVRARYQRAVIRRTQLEDVIHRTLGRLGQQQLEEAIRPIVEDLDAALHDADESMKVSLAHQRGVLELLKGRHDIALSLFESCLKERTREQDASPNEQSRHRIAYEYRRIAQCLALQGRDPTEALNQASSIAKQTQHQRLLHEVERDRHALQYIFA